MKTKFAKTLIAAGLLAAFATSFVSTSAVAEELRIGRGNEPQSIDPQFSRTGPTQMTAFHIFDRLLITDENARTHPGLAESWENIDALTWQVNLRPGVTFHDGSPLTAGDVKFSLERAPDVPNSPASFAQMVADIDSIEVVDDLTLRFKTKRPAPSFLMDIGRVNILSRAVAENADNEDFNSGKAAIGTGPYKFAEWVPGDHLTLVRNDDYWGEKPAYDKVTMRFITNDAARVAALLSGAVDLIDLVPPADLPRLRHDPDINVYETATVRLVYLGLNQRDEAPHITDVNGAPLDRNPLQDPRVRNVISMMIDRQALVDHVLFGSGEPASQMVPEGMFGFDPSIPAIPYDPAKAKELLALAGYPEGFGVTIHGSNDRFLLDGDIAQALGQFLARGGLKVNEVVTLPYSVYSGDARDGAYGAFMFSYGNTSNESSRGLISLLHSFDTANQRGTLNRFRYSNPEFDAAIVAATEEFDPAKREEMLREAARIAFSESALIPLYFQSLAWASTKNVDFVARRDERTLAMEAKPAN